MNDQKRGRWRGLRRKSRSEPICTLELSSQTQASKCYSNLKQRESSCVASQCALFNISSSSRNYGISTSSLIPFTTKESNVSDYHLTPCSCTYYSVDLTKMDYTKLATPPLCVADFCLIPVSPPTPGLEAAPRRLYYGNASLGRYLNRFP